MPSNIYFPCSLVEHDGSYSVICSDFHYFDEYFGGRDGGGYTVERIAKKLARERGIKGLKYDSEAGMSCAYADRKQPLQKLCTQLRKITGGEALDRKKPRKKTALSYKQAERLLLKGFVRSLNRKAQQEFLQMVPSPAMNKQQSRCMRAVEHGSDAEKIQAARRIGSEARTLTRDWNNHLSHPQTTQSLVDCYEATDNPKVCMELLSALSSICNRHLPDLRLKPYFEECLHSSLAQVRIIGIFGLANIKQLTPAALKPLLKDKSKKVRSLAEDYADWLKEPDEGYPSWMFGPEGPSSFEDE